MAADYDPIRAIEDKLDALELRHSETRSDVRSIREDVERLKDDAPKYVTHDRFRPVERIALGLVGAVLLTVVTAILALVIQTK